MSDRKKGRESDSKRVGFLLASIHTGVSPQLWQPLVELAEAARCDLFVFPGGRLSADDRTEAARTRLYSLVRRRNLDGAVSWASSLGGFVGRDELDAFHERMGDLPLVAMAHHLPGRSVVRIDAYSGMRELVSHMAKVHGVRRFAFIRGPAEHESAEDRRRAFLDAQRDAGLEVDPRLIASPRAWNEGEEAITELLDERGLLPGRDFDALLAASDLQLYSAVLVLQGRGYTIPGDLLTAGFNDSIESRILSPAVTTVRLPFAEQAEHAFLALISRLKGETENFEETLPSELVIRQSCGCISQSVHEAGKRPGSAPVRSPAGLRAALLSAAARRCGASLEEQSAWLKPLVDEFASALEGRETGALFLRTLERVMERLIRMERNLVPWQDVLSAFRVEALSRSEERDAAEALIGQGRVIVSEAVLRADSIRIWKAQVTAQAIRDLERDLIKLDDRNELGAVLAAHLPALGIKAAYVAEEDERAETARLIAGFDERGTLGSEHLLNFDAADLLPLGTLPSPSGRGWIVEPLCAGDEYFGRLVVRIGIRDSTVYEELRGALSSALQGLRSIDQIRNAREAAEKAEVLKSRFLASVSGELRAPLKGIIEAADAAVRAVSTKGARVPAGFASALSFIRTAAERQLTLTDDLLDLARCEAGELQLDSALVHPEKLVLRAAAVAERAVEYRGNSAALPLVPGDSGRLARLLALLFDRARPAEVAIRSEACYLAFSVKRVDGAAVPPEDEGGLGRSIAFARRLVSAHLGRLDPIDEGDRTVGWVMRLPYPTLGGGVSAVTQATPKRILVLSEESVIPDDIRAALVYEDGGSDAVTIEAVAPSRLKADTELLSGVSALAWRPPAVRAVAEAVLIHGLGKAPASASLPFLFFPEGDAEVTARSVAELVEQISGAAAAGAVVVCDEEADRGAAVADLLTDPGLPDPIVVAGPDDLETSRLGNIPAVVVLRTCDARFISAARRACAKLQRRPTLLVLVDVLDPGVDLGGLEADPKAILLNIGVFTKTELGLFVRALVSGRAPLPPFTGAIVKRAQHYMNRRFSDAITRWQIADAINVSEDYLTRIFKKELGISPWEYLTRLRVQVARRLLKESPISVREVAEAAGFHDQAYFCRVFRKIEGCTPSVYRSDSPEAISR